MRAFGFIQAERANFPIAVLCETCGVSRSGFYDWVDRAPSVREESDRALRAHIRAAHSRSRGTYGSPRVTAELRDQGHQVGQRRVARLMREAGLQGRPRRRWVTTTDSDHQQPVAENLLDRNFEADAPNEVWAADLTYIPTAEGWLYLAVILDLHSAPQRHEGRRLGGSQPHAKGAVPRSPGQGPDPQKPSAWFHPPQRPREPVRQQRLQGPAGQGRSQVFHEQKGRLLGQRRGRVLLRHAEAGTHPHPGMADPPSCTSGHRQLPSPVLQPCPQALSQRTHQPQ